MIVVRNFVTNYHRKAKITRPKISISLLKGDQGGVEEQDCRHGGHQARGRQQ
jgi:hypothetical protein